MNHWSRERRNFDCFILSTKDLKFDFRHCSNYGKMLDSEESMPDSEDIGADGEDPDDLIECSDYSNPEVLYEFEIASSHLSPCKTVHTFT